MIWKEMQRGRGGIRKLGTLENVLPSAENGKTSLNVLTIKRKYWGWLRAYSHFLWVCYNTLLSSMRFAKDLPSLKGLFSWTTSYPPCFDLHSTSILHLSPLLLLVLLHPTLSYRNSLPTNEITELATIWKYFAVFLTNNSLTLIVKY